MHANSVTAANLGLLNVKFSTTKNQITIASAGIILDNIVMGDRSFNCNGK